MKIIITAKELKTIIDESIRFNTVLRITHKLLTPKQIMKKAVKNVESSLAVNVSIHGNYESMCIEIDTEFIVDIVKTFGDLVVGIITIAMSSRGTIEQLHDKWSVPCVDKEKKV